LQVFSQIEQLDISENMNRFRNVSIPESNLVAFSISFALKDQTAPSDIVDRVRNAFLQALEDITIQVDRNRNFGVLAFQPSGKATL